MIRLRLQDLLEQYLAFVKRFIPESSIKPTVGLDLSPHSCKLVELRGKGNSFELVNCAIEPVVDGEYKQAIRNLLGKLSVPTTAIFTAVYGTGTLVRYIDMPKMSLEEMKKSFSYEADKYFPFPKDQIQTDCYILNAKEKENKMLVLAAAAKKEVITQRVDLLKELGLEADLITLNALALANVFNIFSSRKTLSPASSVGVKTSAIALLDMGERVSNLTILVNGEPRFARDIFIGGNEFTASISNALGLDFRAAEELKCDPQQRSEDIFQACESMIMNLVSEIRLSFDYFATEKNIQIPDLVLTGGGSMLVGLQESFTKNLEMNVQRWSPLEHLSLASHLSVEEVNKNIHRMGVALGLALSLI